MTSHATALVFMWLACSHADTLTLRNGTSVTGSWVGIDARQVRFSVNGQVVPYSRSDVSQLTFGPAPDMASPRYPQLAAPSQPAPTEGQTVEQVIAQLAQPEVIANGEPQTYLFRDWKVAFQNGKAASVTGPITSPEPSSRPGPTRTLNLGQPLEEVLAALGQPVNTVDLGQKKIYLFKDLKVTFLDNKASAFQ